MIFHHVMRVTPPLKTLFTTLYTLQLALTPFHMLLFHLASLPGCSHSHHFRVHSLQLAFLHPFVASRHHTPSLSIPSHSFHLSTSISIWWILSLHLISPSSDSPPSQHSLFQPSSIHVHRHFLPRICYWILGENSLILRTPIQLYYSADRRIEAKPCEGGIDT